MTSLYRVTHYNLLPAPTPHTPVVSHPLTLMQVDPSPVRQSTRLAETWSALEDPIVEKQRCIECAALFCCYTRPTTPTSQGHRGTLDCHSSDPTAGTSTPAGMGRGHTFGDPARLHLDRPRSLPGLAKTPA